MIHGGADAIRPPSRTMTREAERGGRSAPRRQPGAVLLLQAVLIAACAGACGALRLEPSEEAGRPRSRKKATVREAQRELDAVREAQTELEAATFRAEKAHRAENATSRCKYGRFGDGYLTGLQLIDVGHINVNFHNFDQGSDINREGLFVYPEAQFAMCIIEKNGCSTWLTMFNKLTRKKYNLKVPWYGLVEYHWSERRARRVFEDPDATRIAWVRDPLERFLSGFLNKCAVKADRYNDEPSICPFKNSPDQPPGFPLSQAGHWFEVFKQKGKLDKMIGQFDSHFTPQARHCELKRRLHEFTVIGLMNKAHFTQDVECLLERAGLSHVNTMGPSGLPFLKHPTEDVSQIEESTVRLLKKFFTKDFAKLLMDAYKEDYDLFNIERPTWVNDATGEWYNRNSSSKVSLSRAAGDQAAAEELDEEEDDLLKLAARAGYIQFEELSLQREES